MNGARVIGLVLLGLLSLVDAATLLLSDGQFPPLPVAILATVLGLVSLALLVWVWRGNRVALGALVVIRLVSALSAVPAFTVDGVPGPVRVLAAAIVTLTIIGCVLVLPGLRRRRPAPTPTV